MICVFIESHQELARHPKTRKLTRILHINRAQAIGHLHMLWWWCLDYARDGDISGFDSDEIADACDYDGDPVHFLAALTTAGFVDIADDGTKTIHDWYDYAGALLEKLEAYREGNKKRQQAWRDRQKSKQHNANVTERNALRNANVTGRSNLTIPNQIGSDRTLSDPSDLDPSSSSQKRSVGSTSPRVEANAPSRADAVDMASPEYINFVRSQLRVFGMDNPSPYTLQEFGAVFAPFYALDINRVRAEVVNAAEWLQGPNNKKHKQLSKGWLLNWLDRTFKPTQPPTQPPTGGNDDATTDAANEQRRRDRVRADEAKQQALISQSSDRLQRISDLVEERQRRALS